MQCGVCLGLHGDECVCENATLCACVDVGNACLECNRLFVSFVDVFLCLCELICHISKI